MAAIRISLPPRMSARPARPRRLAPVPAEALLSTAARTMSLAVSRMSRRLTALIEPPARKLTAAREPARGRARTQATRAPAPQTRQNLFQRTSSTRRARAYRESRMTSLSIS